MDNTRERDVVFGKSGEKIPLRPGHSFKAWDNAGGTRTALWNENEIYDPYEIDKTYWGADDGVEPIAGGAPISVTDEVGSRGEAIYPLKTAYTEITVDGEKDPVYDYGLHLKGAIGSDEEYYKNRSTCIDIYMIRGQDGRVYVYGEITDPDIVIDPEIMAVKPHHCDGLHPYISFDNTNVYPGILGLISADVECKYQHLMPKNCVAKLTDTGYKFEYAFNKNGMPLRAGEELGFGFYYNDTNDFVDSKNFKRCIVKLPQRLNPAGTKYIPIDSADTTFDAVRFSLEPATGSFSISKRDGSAKKTGDMLRDILGGAASVNVKYSENTPVHSRLNARWLSGMLSHYGADAIAVCDSVESRESDYEINIDLTSDEECRKFCLGLEYNEYGLKFDGNKIYVGGCREDAVKSAVALLTSAVEYVRSGGNTADLDTEYITKADFVPAVPKMCGVSNVTDAGYGAYMLLKKNADEKDLADYCQRLTDAGYKTYAENTMASLCCVTMYNDKAMINLSYGSAEGDRTLRAVVDPRSENDFPVVEEGGYTPVCKTRISQLAPKRIFLMCYVLRLDNGEYLVFDSGGNGAQRFLHDSLLELNGGKHVTVACWFFSHFHCDHIGGFLEMGDREELMKDITVKRIIHNFPQRQVLDTALNPGDQNNLNRWPGIVERSGAKVYHARTGQKWRFGNADIECIFTFEDLQPFDTIADRTNPTSSVFSVTVEGQRFIITGDCCGEATALMAMRYGDWLKSDFVQLPHHGWGDGGTKREFYELSAPRFVLYPGPGYFPEASEKWILERAEEYFLNPENTTTLELPYNK